MISVSLLNDGQFAVTARLYTHSVFRCLSGKSPEAKTHFHVHLILTSNAPNTVIR